MSIPTASAAKIKRLTESECAEWAANPRVNPATGRSIEVNKGTYNAIAKRCEEAYGVVPNGAPGASTSRAPLPKKVGKWKVPQTADEWSKSDIRVRFKRLCAACREFGFITADHLKDSTDFIKIHQILIEHGVIPAAEEAAIAECIVSIIDASVPENVKSIQGRVFTYSLPHYATFVEHAIMNLLRTGHADLDVAQVINNMQLTEFNEYMITGRRGDTEKVTDLLVALEGLKHDIVLMAAPAAAAAAYDLPNSRSRSLPESISQRRVKQMKPKRLAEDPDEYYPWSATEEAAPTDRSRFRSHAKMSEMSPGPSPAPLPPLTPKKRTAMLAELREACTVMKDMISLKRFDRMNKKALQLVVRLGPERAGQQRCYYVKNIYQLWANAAKENKPAKDPLTRASVSEADKNEIMRKVRRLRPDAPDPRNYAQSRDKKLRLAIHQINFNYADIVSEQYQDRTPPPTAATDRGTVGFYNITVRRPVGKRSYLIVDLGFVPSDIELADVGGDANLTSSAVVASIQSLFDSGRLMSSNVIPYECCRIHMGKTMKYWVARTGDSPVANRINLRRWKLMATEVYDAL